MDEIISLAMQLNELYEYNYKLIKPKVISIIKNKVTDIKIIEMYLDMLLNIQTDNGCKLFLELCDYYYTVNREYANEYMQIYKEIYGEDDELKKKKKKN